MSTKDNKEVYTLVPEPLPTHLTYAAVVDVRDVEHEITELMVRRACADADHMQQFPFAPREASRQAGNKR